MTDPSGNLIAIGNSAFFRFTTGAPSTKKCPVVPESDITYFTMVMSFLVLKSIGEFGRLCRLLAFTMCCHTLALVMAGGLRAGLRICVLSYPLRSIVVAYVASLVVS